MSDTLTFLGLMILMIFIIAFAGGIGAAVIFRIIDRLNIFYRRQSARK